MKVSRPEFGSPILCVDDFFSEANSQDILRECVELKDRFEPATILESWDRTKIDHDVRRNDVVYLSQIARNGAGDSRIVRLLRERVREDECVSMWRQENSIFNVINFATREEAILSRYGDGDFYKSHRDASTPPVQRRVVTLVYYANTVPQRFAGGALIFRSGSELLRIETRNNLAVFFPSFVLHEVESVSMPIESWKDSRFSLNYWFGYSDSA